MEVASALGLESLVLVLTGVKAGIGWMCLRLVRHPGADTHRLHPSPRIPKS